MRKAIFLSFIIALLFLAACGMSAQERFEERLQNVVSDGEILYTSRLTPLAHIDGTWQLIIKPYDYGEATTSIEISGASGRVFRETADSTITSSALDADTDYIVTVERDGESVQAIVHYTFEEGLTVDDTLQRRDSMSFVVSHDRTGEAMHFESLIFGCESLIVVATHTKYLFLGSVLTERRLSSS
ncbi:MAG: hypothetical protein FWE06_08520 [Oscillospiraceae bacterium]|nr:hypothetical protein [Oscillospiraceae bacterium]